jgi:hypothetical protein
MRRRRGRAEDPTLRAAFGAFFETAGQVEEAKETLLLGVPSGRAPRLALADALAGFEAGLADALSEMDTWRLAALEPEWQRCLEALRESAGRAERLRLEGGPEAYEELAPILDELLDPLDAFGVAARRFRDLGM